jgi:DNA-binding MarR family transcriptional regulator/ribosomal protein S18 acetylase RimI-like enzyme
MDHIDRLRAFNRYYTRRLGLLDRSYLGSGLTLTEVRLLYELQHHPGQTARSLARGLGLDEGYLSRCLAAFVRRGWLAQRPDPDDRRVKTLTLTEAGAAAFAPLEAQSRAEVGALLDGLPPGARDALPETLEDAVRLIEGGPVALRDLGPGDAGWVIGRHGALYARDEGYDCSFEALVASILSDFLTRRDPICERGWIAEQSGRRLGSIFCVRDSDDVARLRLFLVEPQVRGLGLGQRLLDTCQDFARAAGYRRMVLWTHESHRAACALYARNGWRLTSSRPGRAFGQPVVDQEWDRELGSDRPNRLAKPASGR